MGARPQFIKAAALSRSLVSERPDVEEVIVHTGQHYDLNMSDIFFKELDIPRPAFNLGVGGGTHGQNTGRMLEKIEALAMEVKPDWVVVFGDTDSTLAGALVAAKLQIPIAHVEAGLRSFNRHMPEEINRVLTDHVSELLFAPTEAARANLLHEGIDASKIHVFGDVMYDVALYYRQRARQPAWFEGSNLEEEAFALCTVHRAENTDSMEKLRGILDGLASSPLAVVLPLHPRTRKSVTDVGLVWPSNIRIVDPVGYLEMVWLERHCRFVITDSGGIQKEAFFYGKPCITLREETEWVELVEHGWNRLAGSSAAKISELVNSVAAPPSAPELYGRGDAALRMVREIR